MHAEVREQKLKPSDAVAPFLRVTQMRAVDAFADDVRPPGQGFAFYPYEPA